MYNTKNKSATFVISLLSLLIIPILGVITSIVGLTKAGSNKSNYFIISLFFFILFITIPPVSDLFRHYVTFVNADYSRGLINILQDKFDIILPLSIYFIHIMDLSFYLLPGFYVAVSIYLILSTVGNVIKSADITITQSAYITLHVISICLVPVFIIALGLRFGLACFIAIYACSLFAIKKISARKFIVLSTIAVLTHFSVTTIIISTILSKFITFKKHTTVLLTIIAFFSSGIVLPFLVSNITWMGLNKYADVYLSGIYSSSENKNLNGLINYYMQYTPFIIFSLYFIKTRRKPDNKLYSLCSTSIIILALTSVAPVAAGRFVLPTTYFLFFYYIQNINAVKKLSLGNIFLFFTLVYCILYFLFENIYIQRRPIALGQMWSALYTPPAVNIINLDDKFDSSLKQINKINGEWIGHETDGA